jgi:F-type H+-transporting ATPase subunit b
MSDTVATKADIQEVSDASTAAPGTVAEAEHAAVHETVLGLDSYAIVGLAFLTFVLILWKVGAFSAIIKALDGQAEKVKADLAEAAALKAEARALKDRATADAAEARAQAEAMLASAEAEAKRIMAQAISDAEAAIARRTRLAEDRIAAEARSAEAELRARAADITVKASETLLAARAKDLASLADTAIAGLDRH